MHRMMKQIPAVLVDWQDGSLRGEGVETRRKTLGDMRLLFDDQAAVQAMPDETLLYTVQAYRPPNAAEEALCWGCTVLQPGRVGDEYFMTHGHFHERRERAEVYATVAGRGALLLMDDARKTWLEPMQKGSVHFISGQLAHRVVNTGDEPLRFLACWPGDAGHDYEAIARLGFGARLRRRAGEPVLVEDGRD